MPLLYAVGFVLALLVGVAGLALLLGLSVAAAALGAVATAVFTVVVVPLAVCRALLGVLRDDELGHLRVAPPDPTPPGRDPGYLGYYFGPAWHDYALATSRGAAEARARTVGRVGRTAPKGQSTLDWLGLLWHVPDELDSWGLLLGKIIVGGGVLGGLVGLVAGGLLAGVFLAVTMATYGLLLGALGALLLVICTVLRLFELGLLRLRRVTVECPSCHDRVAVPVYECPNCQELHRRLVPGSMGILARTCRCGEELPTLLGHGRSRLRAHCGRDSCRGVLPLGALTVPTLHVPLVAGEAAGKTVYTMAAIADLTHAPNGATGSIGFDFGDEPTRERFAEVSDALRNIAAVAPTLASAPLRAATFYLGSAPRKLVYLYDAAGESYQTSDGVSTLRFLGTTAGVLLIVDPFALAPVRTRLEDDGVPLPPHSVEPPSSVAARLTRALREQRALSAEKRIDVPVAVVLTKCDVLIGGGQVRHPYEGLHLAIDEPGTGVAFRFGAVEEWLQAAGEGGFVRDLRAHYRWIGYFAVSALDAFGTRDHPSARSGQPVRNDPPSAPLQWLLAASSGRPE
ncbi:MAG TPA: hypothetical protein VGE11_27875 [Pseudonocardia sp.]